MDLLLITWLARNSMYISSVMNDNKMTTQPTDASLQRLVLPLQVTKKCLSPA